MPVDNSIALQTKAPSGLTGLGDMLNLARGAQAYQQAQQLNPLAVQAAELEVQKQQGMLQPSIRQAEAQAGSAELGLTQSQLSLAGGMLTGLEYSDAFRKGNIPEIKSQVRAFENIAKANKIPVENTFGQLNQMLDSGDIKGAQSFVANLRTGLASHAEKFSASQPSVQNVAGQPALVTTGGPTPGITSPQYENKTGVVTAAPTSSGAVPNMFPVREPGVALPPPTAQEASAQAAGDKYFTSVIEAQPKLAQQTRNISEIVKTAHKIEGEAEILGKKIPTSGWAGDAYRKIYGGVGGTEYQELAKDLANAQISLAAVGGSSLSTDQGKQLAAAASGTVSTNPKVIIDIAERTAADVRNIDAQAEAAQKFAAKNGTNNMASFQRMWGKNADTKVFQVMNIVDNVENPKEREALFKKLYPTDKERKEGLQKYKNIRKLMNDGTL